MTSRPSVKEHLNSSSQDHVDEALNSSESDAFISGHSERPTIHTSRLMLCLKPMRTLILNACRLVCINNRLVRIVLSIIRSIYGGIQYILQQLNNIIPADMVIHVFTAVLVTCGTLTLFLSPSFRSKLSEMRQRPATQQNGILDALAWSSDKFAVLESNSSLLDCSERYFRCEYYWASETDGAMNTVNTVYCSAYVCKGMAVTVTVLPQSCSQSNRIGIGAIMKEIYSNPVYSCGNSGCGECSTLRYHASEDGIVSFLQGCQGDDSCYGQVEVSIEREVAAPSVVAFKGWSSAPWVGFRGGQFHHGTSHISSRAGSPLLMAEAKGGGFASSPAVSSKAVAYVGSEDMYLYAMSSKGPVWKYLTEGKVLSSPVLSFSESAVYVGSNDHYLHAVDTATGKLLWKYMTGGAIISSPTYVADIPILNRVDVKDAPGLIYVGSGDGILYAITSDGSLRWRFATSTSTSEVSTAMSICSSPCVSPDEATVYFGSDDFHFYAVSSGGMLKWKYRTNGAITSSPAVSSDGLTLYFGSQDMHLYALTHTGVLKWRYYADSPIHSSPSLAEDVLYFGTMARVASRTSSPTLSPTQGESSDVKNGKPATGNKKDNSKKPSKGRGKRSRTLRMHAPHVRHSSPALLPYVPDPLHNGGALVAITSSGELLWRYSIPLGTLSSPLHSADGSLIIGAEDGYLYRVSSKGNLKWKTQLSGPISASPGVDDDGNIYFGTSGVSRFYILGTDRKKIDNEEKYQKFSPDLSTWSCSALTADEKKNGIFSVDSVCEAAEVRPGESHRKCSPGIAQYLGNGVDITMQINDPSFVTTRVIEFKNLDGIEAHHGVEYLSPSEGLKTIELSHLDPSNALYSGVFRGVREYSNKQALSLGISPPLMAGSIPIGTMESALANSTGRWSSTETRSMSEYVASNAVTGQATFVNAVTYAHTQYSMLPQQGGSFCSSLFRGDVMDLGDRYIEHRYMSFVQRFGTHVIVDVTLGGSIAISAPYDPCAAAGSDSRFTFVEAFSQYRKEMENFVLHGKRSTHSNDLTHGHIISVCGGDVFVPKGETDTPFTSWTQSTTDTKFQSCAVILHLIPIYALMHPEDGRRVHLEATVADYMNKAINIASLSAVEVTSCKNVLKPSERS